MLDDWKQAWRQAVENFQREMHGGTQGAPPRVRAMERELVSASGALAKLDTEIVRTRRAAEDEAEAEQVCRRREALARQAEDDETVRIAVEFAVRHAERGALLTRKLAVLEEERALLSRDIDTMRTMVAAATPAAGSVGGGETEAAGDGPDPRGAADREFSRLERDARERAADARLEELKRRMGQ
jgi:hypothetical protein